MDKMFRCKTKTFYNNYFKKIKDFKLISPFEEKEGVYFGIIESVGTVHPITIDVEIPKRFPHQMMIFWTVSLYGYPHLIYSEARQKCWFCLNTPFAETAENQLSYEIDRLRGWIKKMMHKGLPAHINNIAQQHSLRIANAFSWEIFENDEYNSDARLIFIGDFAKNKRNFSKEGYLYCKKIPLSETASRFFAFERDNVGLEKIPYLLVDSKCVSNGSLESLSTSYGIDDDTWERLLPRMHVSERCYVDKIMMVDKILENMPSVEKDFKENFIPEEHRVYIEQFLKHNKESKSPLYTELDDDLVFHNGEIYDGKTFNSLIENYILREWYFALGICSTDSIEWQLFSTNRMKKLSRVTTYKLGGVGININDCYDIELNCHRTSITDYQHFFGRGAMSANLSNCKIAIIGVGAIGSILLETLVRGGAKHISVWDGDNVEPGNICRSIYNLNDIGRNKTTVCVEHMSEISPFCCVTPHPYNLYGKYNYDSQEDVYKELSSFDIIFDCTASNELLHFLSYTFTNTPIVSICITNHAKDILCLCSTDGNPYYQRKAFLAMIEQDTQNFYAEGTGCYSPTFLATNSHISYLVNMYVADLFSCFKSKSTMRSVIYNCDGKNTNTDYLLNYKLESYNIILTIPESVIRKINLMPDSYDYAIGYLFGTYSEDGKQIFVCDAVCSKEASDAIEEIFASSEGIIDYIGEIHYSGISEDTYSSDIFKSLQAKAYSQDINSNNPLLAIRNPEGDISYFLFINNNLDKFQEQK